MSIKEEVLKIGRGIKKLRFFKFADLRGFLNILTYKEKVVLATLLAILVLDMFSISRKYYLSATVTQASFGGSFSEGVIGEPKFINPLLAQSRTDKDLTNLVFSGLYKYENSAIVPSLAASDPEISTDQKQYTIRLKENLKWHNNQDISADDVVFTFGLLQNPDYKSPQMKLWKNIKVEKIDNLTVKFTNNDVSSPILSNLTLGILPQNIWSKISASDFYTSKYNLEAIGSGPYSIKELSKSVSGNIRALTFKAFADYSAGRPYINEITMKFYADNEQLIAALHTKEVDAIGFVPFSQKIYVDPKKSNLSVLTIPLNQYQGLFFNLKKSSAVLGDRSVRQALAQSVDRNAFIKDVYLGMAVPAYSPILPGQLGYLANPENKNLFNPGAATDLLEKAGWIKDSSGFRIKAKNRLQFTITTNDFVLNQRSAENLQDQWAKIGAEVKVNIVPTADLEKNFIRSRNFEALLFSESTGFDPDPFVFWHSSQSNDPGLNLAAYKNNTIDALIADARTNFDKETRIKDYEQFQEIFSIDLPAIILDQSVFVYQMHPKIKGVGLKTLANAENRFYDIGQWYVEDKRVWK